MRHKSPQQQLSVGSERGLRVRRNRKSGWREDEGTRGLPWRRGCGYCVWEPCQIRKHRRSHYEKRAVNTERAWGCGLGVSAPEVWFRSCSPWPLTDERNQTWLCFPPSQPETSPKSRDRLAPRSHRKLSRAWQWPSAVEKEAPVDLCPGPGLWVLNRDAQHCTPGTRSWVRVGCGALCVGSAGGRSLVLSQAKG